MDKKKITFYHRTSHEVCISIDDNMVIFGDGGDNEEYKFGYALWDVLKGAEELEEELAGIKRQYTAAFRPYVELAEENKELEEENKCLKEKECTSTTCEVFAENQRLRDKMLEAIEYIKLYRHSKGMVVLQDALQDKEE